MRKQRKTSNEGMWFVTVKSTFSSTDTGHDIYCGLEYSGSKIPANIQIILTECGFRA